MGKLIKCPVCKKRIACDAPVCPKCGHRLTDEERDNGVREEKKSCMGCLIFFVVVLAIGFVMEMFDKDKTSSAPVAVEQTGSQAPAQQQVETAPIATQSEQSTPPEDFTFALTPEEEKEYAETRERTAKKTPPEQAKLNKLYKELLSMRNTREFKELGFSAKNKTSTEWKNRVDAFAEHIKKDADIPIEVKVAPSYLIMLGLDKAWREGATTSDSKWNTQMVMDALNWKLEE